MVIAARTRAGELVGFAVLAAALAIFLSFVFRGNMVPIVSDEIGYFSVAKYLASGEQVSMAVMPSYRFGYAFLLTPFFAAGLADHVVYQIGVVINCVQLALIPGLLMLLAERFDVPRTWPLVAASVLVVVFPAYTYQLTVLWPETSLRFAWVLLVYLAASGWQTKSGWYWLSSVAVAIWMVALHGRGIAAIPALLIFLAVGWWAGRIKAGLALACIGITIAGVVAVSEVQKAISDAVWGRSGGDFKFIKANLLRPGGITAIFVTLAGHLWSQVASSFGAVIVGFAGAIWWARHDAARAAIVGFVILACGASAVSAAMHLAMMTRVDYLLYSRYNDVYAIIFVWIGVIAVLSAERPLRWAAALVLVSLVVLGGIAGYGGIGVKDVVTPNIPGLIWIGKIIDLQAATHGQVIAIGSLVAALAAFASLYFYGWRSLIITVPFLALLGLHTKGTTWASHNARAHVVDLHRPIYAAIDGELYWDRSTRTNLNLLFDEYIALDYAMTHVDLRTGDIPAGRSAIVAPSFEKAGYVCAARLHYDAIIVTRGAGSSVCAD